MNFLRLPTSTYNYHAAIKVDFAIDKQLIALVKVKKEATYLKSKQELLGHGSSKITERYTQASTHEIGNIVNPLEAYYSNKSGTIHSKNGTIKPLKGRDKENKHHKGVCIQVM